MARRAKKYHAIREGLGPMKIVLPLSDIGKTIFDALQEKDIIPKEELIAALSCNDIVDIDSIPINPSNYVTGITPVYMYRKARPEKPVPYEMPLIEHNNRFIIVDKPPFLASIPKGMHITETALVRARRYTGIDTLSPAHRLDRLTSGLLLFTTTPEYRSTYQKLFSARKVTKYYRALAPRPKEKNIFPLEVTSRIEKTPGIMNAQEVPGPHNSHTIIDYIGDHSSGLGEYLLQPLTGKTHQLRIHMSKIGIPISGDPLYPVNLYADSTNFSIPLQLRAHQLCFIDPITKIEHIFTSRQKWIFPSIPHSFESRST